MITCALQSLTLSHTPSLTSSRQAALQSFATTDYDDTIRLVYTIIRPELKGTEFTQSTSSSCSAFLRRLLAELRNTFEHERSICFSVRSPVRLRGYESGCASKVFTENFSVKATTRNHPSLVVHVFSSQRASES